MLQKSTVAPELIETAKGLQALPLFANFYLAGGTSLALQLGHRTSTDIDLFSYTDSNFFKLSQYLHKNNDRYKIDMDQEGFIRIFSNGIKIELIYDDIGKLIKEPITIDGIICMHKHEIAPMKLKAICSRNRSRDIIDIAYLLQEMPLESIFSLYKEKYGPSNVNILKRELLLKSKMVDDNGQLADIKMLRNDIRFQDIPKIIENSIDDYNCKMNIGRNLSY